MHLFAVALLVGHQKEHPACEELGDEMLPLSGARCKWFA